MLNRDTEVIDIDAFEYEKDLRAETTYKSVSTRKGYGLAFLKTCPRIKLPHSHFTTLSFFHGTTRSKTDRCINGAEL